MKNITSNTRLAGLAGPDEETLATCDLCGAPSSFSRRLYVKYGSPVVQCPKCSLLYVNPRARTDILWQRYSQAYFENEYLPQHGIYHEQLNYQAHAPLLHQLRRYAPNPGRLLDIGCAIGLFLAAARLEGWEVVGNELSRFAADYAAQHFNLPVLPGNVHDLDLEPGSFDAVTLWETIEHVLSPQAVARQAARLLRPGGVLALSTPNVGGATYFFLRDRWWIIAPREHIFYFTPKTLTRLLGQAGFEIKQLWTAGTDFHYFYNTLRGREVPPQHTQLADLPEAATALDPAAPWTWPRTAWLKAEPILIPFLRKIVHRLYWADTLFVYAVRQA